jgi:hypothetical protein
MVRGRASEEVYIPARTRQGLDILCGIFEWQCAVVSCWVGTSFPLFRKCEMRNRRTKVWRFQYVCTLQSLENNNKVSESQCYFPRSLCYLSFS